MADHVLSILVKATGASAASKEVGTLNKALGSVGGTATRFGGALGHAKHSIGELLTGPLGVLGLAGGVGGLGVGLEKVISHTNDFAFSVEKLTGLTGGSAESMSTLLAVFEKFNIDAERTGQIVGFAEKTLGKLSQTSGKAGKSGLGLAKAQAEVTKAHERLNVAETKLREVESKSSTSASTLQAARYRVRDATQALTLAEKKLAGMHGQTVLSSSKLQAIDKQYGLQLVDSKGKLVDFETELKQVADVYTSSLDPAKKAALAAQLFGRGYADLVPILALGSKGITEAEQAAKDLGLTLTAQNASDLKQYRESLRETGDAIGGLELQIGLALVPAIKDMADAITSFLKNGGREAIVGFFKGLISAGRSAASVITGTIVPALGTIASAAKGAWDAIPPGLRDLLVKGFVANKAVKFVFGVDIAGGVADVIKKAFAGAVTQSLVATGIGKMFVQPVFVTNPGFGGLAGAGGEAAAAGEGAAAGGGLTLGSIISAIAAPVAATAAVAGVAAWQNSQISDQSDALRAQTAAYAKVATDTQLASSIDGVRKDLDQMTGIGANAYGQKGTTADVLNLLIAEQNRRFTTGNQPINGSERQEAVFGATPQQTQAAEMNARRIEEAENRTGNIMNAAGKTIGHQLDALHQAFKTDLGKLIHATKAVDIAKAARAVAAEIKKGVGGVASTKAVLRDLKVKLAETHDPKLEHVLRAAIATVERKIPGREWIQKQIGIADKELASSDSLKQKVATLTGIEQQFRDRGDTHAAALIGAKILTVKQAINAKKLSTSVSVHNTVNVNAQISARDQNHVTVSQSRAYSTIGGVVRAS